MRGVCLNFETPISDAVSRIRFASHSDNLLISSWDSSLRLYDVESSVLRLEAPSNAALLDCCFQSESMAFSAGSDGFIRRYDLHSGTSDAIGNHCHIATCIEYSHQTCQLISTGLDKNIMFWDMRAPEALAHSRSLSSEIESMSIDGFDLMVAVGASVNIYDLRNLERPVHLKESRVDVQIRCINSILHTRGYAVGSVDGRVALDFLNQPDSNGTGYAFRCHPKSKDGKSNITSINDIVFNPLICGMFVTGDNEGHVIVWDSQSKRKLYEFPRYPNSVASLSYNNTGQILAVAASYTYKEAYEMEVSPQIFIHKMDDGYMG